MKLNGWHVAGIIIGLCLANVGFGLVHGWAERANYKLVHDVGVCAAHGGNPLVDQGFIMTTYVGCVAP